MTQRRKEVEVGTLFLGNDKSNVIGNYLLSYFLCLSFWAKWLSKDYLKSRNKSTTEKNK